METVKFKDIPKGQCFTFKDAVYVYYEDTQKGESKRTFHCYKDGQLWKTSVSVQNENEDFYMCDVDGRYIPYSLIMKMLEMQKELKELKRKSDFEPTLTTGYSI